MIDIDRMNVNSEILENARIHTRMLRNRYQTRNRMRMIEYSTINNENIDREKKKKRKYSIPPLQARPTNIINNRRKISSSDTKLSQHKLTKFPHLSKLKKKRQNKASSLPVVIPRLKLQTIKSMNCQQAKRHKSEPVSCRNHHDRVLPKLQCLKSHRAHKQKHKVVISFDKLSQRWFELTFLLRKEIDCIESFKYTQNTANQSLIFLSKLNAIANDLGILRGTLSRALLPFDTNTSVSDQANVENKSQLNNGVDVLNKIKLSTQQQLKYQLISLRQLVKVKIADDADLDQCRDALLTIKSFCKDCQKYCNQKNIHLTKMLNKLKHS